jgi:hypothetical protein
MVRPKYLSGSTLQGAVEYWLQFSDPDKIEKKIHEWNNARQERGESE